MMRKQIYRWQLELDRKTLRERIVLFVVAIMIIWIMWDLFLISPAKQHRQTVIQEIQVVQKNIDGFTAQQQHLEADAADPMNQQLVQRYQQLQQQLAAINHKIITYKFRTVSPEQMAIMLQSVLKDISGVTISHFKTIDSVGNPKQRKSLLDKFPIKIEAKTYQLQIVGDYFALQRYLERLEHLDWQMYWDDFTYTVVKYPTAKLTLRFHTLSIGNT